MVDFRTPQRELGRGQFDSGGFSDPELDRIVDDAVSTVDREGRATTLNAAIRRGTELHATLPLFALSVIVATRRGLAYPNATNEHTLAMRAPGALSAGYFQTSRATRSQLPPRMPRTCASP